MAGFRELEGPETGSPPMSSEWWTACSQNTGMFCRMKRPKPSLEAVCQCSGPRFPTERSQSLSGWFNPLNPRSGPRRAEGAMMKHPVVLITGALTGIGRAAALSFAAEGSRIVVSGRHEEAGQALATELRALGAEAEFVRADVRHEDDVRESVDQTVARFGRLDAAVNTAGTEGHPGPVIEQSADSYAATFDTNVLGTLLSMKHELRVMQAQGGGSIVNISSTYGHLGARGASVYSASKHAV